MKRKDGEPVPPFIPGQYIALTIDIPNTTHKHTRNYSLSDSNEKDYLRISIKKESGIPEGIVSNYLHDNISEGDILELRMPSGEFTLKETEKPIVLISGGIGITPLISMFKKASKNKSQKITFIQCVLNSDTHAFSKEIHELLNENITTKTVYSLPLTGDILGKDYDYKGYLTSEIIEDLNINSDSEFYFCGPTPFMANTLSILENLNVKSEHINYEFFGPVEELSLSIV